MPKTEELIFRFIIIFTVLFVLLSCFITYIIYRYKQKQNAHQQAMQSIKVAHDNALLQAQLEMQEQTFVNIAREIHDNVGQKLSFVKLQLVTLQGKGTQHLEEAIHTIGNSLIDLSDLSRTLHADALLSNGFIHAVDFEVKLLQKVYLFEIDLTVQGEAIFLIDKQELILYRIIQEALHNIVKHAAASVVHITIKFEPSSMNICIQDNGKGFDSNTIKKGQGLLNIKARVKMLNGEYSINSILQQGTSITINIPTHAYNNQ
jgi:two-component system, NarL family, sensor kinase